MGKKSQALKTSKSTKNKAKDIEKVKNAFTKAKETNEKEEKVNTRKNKVTKSKPIKNVESKGHKTQLDSLAENDPEFHEFLLKNNPELLDFDASDDEEGLDLDDMDDEDDEDDDDENDRNGSSDNDSDSDSLLGSSDDEREENNVQTSGYRKIKPDVEVTQSLLKESIDNACNGSKAALKTMLTIFRAACIPSSDDDGKSKDNRYILPSPEIYEAVMIKVLQNAWKSFYKLLRLSIKEKLTVKAISNLEENSRWKVVQMQVLGLFKSIIHVLSSLAESSLQNETAGFILSHLEPYIPLLAPLPRLFKTVLKTLLSIWSREVTSEEDSLNARGHAFLRVRQMAIVLPGTCMDECFRLTYLNFARSCRSFTEINANAIMFMIQSVVELYTIDHMMAYQHSFLFIRQLALHLRQALVKKTVEHTKHLVSWQYLNCLRLWTYVLSALPDEENELGKLIFPLTEVINGVLLAVPSAQGLPLRIHLIGFQHMLAAHGKKFIPTARYGLEVLEFPELETKPKPSTDRVPNLLHMTRIPKDNVHKAAYRDTIVEQACELIRRDSEIYRYHPGFPEYAFLTIRSLKKYNKKCKNSKWRGYTRNLTSQLEEYSTFAKKRRGQLRVGPMEAADLGLEPLKPQNEPSAGLRLMRLMRAAGRELKEVHVDNTPVKELDSSVGKKQVKKGYKKDKNSDSDSVDNDMKESSEGSGSEDEDDEDDEEEEGDNEESDPDSEDESDGDGKDKIKPMDLDDF